MCFCGSRLADQPAQGIVGHIGDADVTRRVRRILDADRAVDDVVGNVGMTHSVVVVDNILNR